LLLARWDVAVCTPVSPAEAITASASSMLASGDPAVWALARSVMPEGGCIEAFPVWPNTPITKPPARVVMTSGAVIRRVLARKSPLWASTGLLRSTPV
jgi:hypothetical protein